MAIPFPDNINLGVGNPLDSKYLNNLNAPYVSLSAVTSTIVESQRYVGLTVLVESGGVNYEFWFKEGVTDGDLVLKTVLGPISGATNLGSGNGAIFTIVTGNTIQLKTLSGGTNINLTSNSDYITINSTISASITGATNLGTGNGVIFTNVIDSETQLKTLSGGTNITLTCNDNYIGINSTASGALSDANNGLTKSGSIVALGGVLTGNTVIDLNEKYFRFDETNQKFDSGTGFDGNGVNTIVQQTDDKILVGGYFTTYSGVTANYIIRLNSDGSIDNTFDSGSGFNNSVWIIALQSDGKILAGGNFTTYSGVTANNIIRLNSDGSIDNTFDSGTGFGVSSTVSTIVLQSDNKILVGGSFTTYSGVTANYIIRLNSDGSIDNTFDSGTGFGGTGVNIIALQSDNKILVGGVFTSYSGVTANYIIRLNSDGSIDNTFDSGTGFNGSILSIASQSDNKILAGGSFTTYSGVTANNIIRLNSDGSIDNTFDSGTGFDIGLIVITLQSDGKILVGGDFTTYSGVTANYIIRLNSDGSIDNTFDSGTGFGVYGVNTIVQQTDDKILVGGYFTTYSGVTANNIIRLNSDGSIDDATYQYSITIENNLIKYGGDYSGNFTDHSLVDKSWVLSQISGGTSGGITGATNGLIANAANQIGLGGMLTGDTIICGMDHKLNLGDDTSATSALCEINIITPSFNWADSCDYNSYLNIYQADTNSGLDMYLGGTVCGGAGMSLASGYLNIYGNGDIGNACCMYFFVNSNYVSSAQPNYDFKIQNGLHCYQQRSILTSPNVHFVECIQDYNNSGLNLKFIGCYTNRCFDFINNGLSLMVIGSGGTKVCNLQAKTVETCAVYINATGDLSYGVVTSPSNNIYEHSAVTTSVSLSTGSSHVILVNATGVTLTLPATPVNGQAFKIKDASGQALTYNITINGNGNNIDGSACALINTNYGAVELMYDIGLDAWFGLSFVN